MYKQSISAEKLVDMAVAATTLLAPEIYGKGKHLYHRGLIKFAREFGPRIYATVDDGKTYSVTINIDDFSQSVCTCSQKHFCEHIAAVFLYYYEPWLLENKMLSGLKHPVTDKTAPAHPPLQLENPAPPAAVPALWTGHPGAGRAGQRKKPGPVVPAPVPSMEGPVELWYKYFEHEYNRMKEFPRGLLQSSRNGFPDSTYFLAGFFEDFAARVAGPGEDWPAPVKDVYRLHSILFFMSGQEKQMAGRTYSQLDVYNREFIESEFIQALAPAMSHAEQETFRPFFRMALEVLRENLFREGNSFFDWLSLYRFICAVFSENSVWRREEAAFLEEKMRRFKKGRRGYYCAALGLAGLKMTAREEDEALSLLRELREIRIEDMFFYLDYLYHGENWEKLLALLRWLAPGAREAPPGVLEDICECCVQAAEKSGAGEAFIGLVRSWLPRSLDSYADYLLEAGLYREWAELNMTYRGYTWDNMDKNLLWHLESKDPAAIIPLYHQWTAGLIEEKNRKSYQQAVKLLKKLRTLYNRQRMKDEWRAFISRLASHYQRLRAFQEELRKGKLIS